MSSTPTSTIAALCYAQKRDLNFSAISSDMQESLSRTPFGAFEISANYPDFVAFDLDDTRICLAYCDMSDDRGGADTEGELPTYGASLVLSVGTGPTPQPGGLNIEQRQSLCEALLDCIEDQNPADHFFWVEVAETFDADLYDMILDQIWPSLSRGAAVPASILDRRDTPETLVDALDDRLIAELKTRQAEEDPEPPAAAPIYKKVARQTYAAHTEKFRAALSHGRRTPAALIGNRNWTAPAAFAGSFRQRAAIYAMNASVLAISLPIGAAVMAYSMLGHESLPVSARTLTITGLAAGLGHGVSTSLGVETASVAPLIMSLFA